MTISTARGRILLGRLLAGTLFALSGAISCSGDKVSGPKDADVSGAWTYNADVGSGGVSCMIRGRVLTFTQSGSTFSGTWNGGTIFCTLNGVTSGGTAGNGVVAGGTVSINNVNFNFDTPDFSNTGVISGATISGTASAKVNATTGTVIATGAFSAVRR